MLDVNGIIAENIQEVLKEKSKTQEDLIAETGISKERISKILNGTASVCANELQKIADCLQVPKEALVKLPENPKKTDVRSLYKGRINSEEGEKGIRTADEISDMILFHSKICRNGQEMEQPWND